MSYQAKACPHCGHKLGGSSTVKSLTASAVAKRQAGQPLSAGDKVKVGIGAAYAVALTILGIILVLFLALVVYACARASF